MKRTMKHVALDVHQATTVASVREEGGRVIARTVLPTEAPALVEFFRSMRGAIHVAFEEGTQAQWLHELLVPLVDRVVVCDRRGESRQGNKGDQVDADQLSEQLRCGNLRAVYHGSGRRAALKELSRTYQNLVEDTTRVMLRLKALFRARAIPTAGTTVYHPRGRARWLAQLPDRGARFRAEALYAELDVLRALRPKAKAAMVAEARRDPAWPVLRAIPFLGPVRVAVLLATMRTPWRFRTKRHLWGYAGLAVVIRSTADYLLVAGRPVRGDCLAGGSWIRDEGAGGSLEQFVRPASSRPRHSPNSRPPRRTRRSVRPAPGRVSDRTMVRGRATPVLACVQSDRELKGGERCGSRLPREPGSTSRPRPQSSRG